MKKAKKFLKRNLKGHVRSFIVIVLTLFLSVPLAGAVTTISTDVVTGGNLQASSTLLVTGAVTTYAGGTLGAASTDIFKFTGQLHASTTSLFTSGLTTYGDSLFGDAVTDITKFTGQLHASSTVLLTSGLTSYSTVTLQNAETIGNATDGNVFIAATTLSVATTTASTTAGSLWVAAPAGTATATVQIGGNRTGEVGGGTLGSCIQMWREGLAYRITINDAGTGVIVTAGSCRD